MHLADVVIPVVDEKKQETTTEEVKKEETVVAAAEVVQPEKRNKGGYVSEAPVKKEYLLPIEVNDAENKILKRTNEGVLNGKKVKKQKREFSNEKKTCKYGDACKYSHDIVAYIASKPPTLGRCYQFDTYGKCKFGITCLFGECHIVGTESIVNEEVMAKAPKDQVTNEANQDIIVGLRKKQIPFPKTEEYFKKNNLQSRTKKNNRDDNQKKVQDTPAKQEEKKEEEKKDEQVVALKEEEKKEEEQVVSTTSTTTTATVVEDIKNEDSITVKQQTHEGTEIDVIIPLKQNEKKKLDFRNQLYLAPLTTVGNLPFRRICKQLGVDITCGEMVLASNIVQGQKSELALFKRHASEDKFGVQLCGPQLDSMMSTSEFIESHLDVDFVDINSGCPIDLICHMGAGAAMMERQNRMEMLVRGMSSVLTCPLTIKLRIGKSEETPNAHRIIPLLKDWGASAVTVHGRSRAQRYSRLANWEYIKTCAAVSPIPLIGNGDIYNWRDIEKADESVSSLMVARGALIKPWIFTEIKEKRDWDISSSERLELIKKFSQYGLDHWGSDQQGVDNTRHFLLNWLSFTHRYVPVGILETCYSKINDRPPGYFGRDDLETLMASAKVSDWIKLSEMFLGPVSSGYNFTPKHNSNAYEAQG
eukprot:gene19856-23786_t